MPRSGTYFVGLLCGVPALLAGLFALEVHPIAGVLVTLAAMALLLSSATELYRAPGIHKATQRAGAGLPALQGTMLRYAQGPLLRGAGTDAGMRRSSPNSLLDVEFAQLSDRGCVREDNEDYLGFALPATPDEARTQGWLFAVADGVGGQEQGQVAAKAAVEKLVAGFREAPKNEAHTRLLPRLIQTANTHVYETGRTAAPASVAMATTIVACALRFDRLVVAHVGDSRCYLIRRGHARLLTRDHTVAGEQLRLGVLSTQEAASARTRHLLSRSLGNDLFVAVDTSEDLLLTGDVLLLCSDGLHGPVTAADMAHVVSSRADLQAAAQELVAIANQRDGSDNISLQLIRVRGVERMGMYRGRPYKLR
ncbi:MAG: protein phosphatase 2C domain-containing protein [Candidatus Sulfotelmatobacter sp.]